MEAAPGTPGRWRWQFLRHATVAGWGYPLRAGGSWQVLDSSRSGWEYESEDAPPPPQESEDLEAAASSERAFQAPGRGGDS